MADPSDILEKLYQKSIDHLDKPFIDNTEIVSKVRYISTNITNRACSRFLMACLLAKIHKSSVDIRKPYTEIGGSDSYSGRTYDQDFINPFIHSKGLPCNPTTAFLTPAFRNINEVLTPDVDMVGRPKEIYSATLELLNLVHNGKITPDDLLAEIIRELIIYKREKERRLQSLLIELKSAKGTMPLSSESIINLIQQHLSSPKASRLPVLVVAAAYVASSEYLNEKILPLSSHNAADSQTQNLGDIEITLIDDEEVVTSYEMKTRKVTKEDVDDALNKIEATKKIVDNYIFITTDRIDESVQDYCRSLYEKTGGIEVVILDCIGFLRHFLHLFHRIRMQYLDVYQDLLLKEPESAVNQPLKEVFLSLRQAAEIDKN